jgi:hypothetical protein
LLSVAILVTACVGPTATETPAPYFETPDRTGACDLIVAMAPVMADAAEAATMADKRVLLDRASLATLGTRARAIRLSFAAQDQAVPPGRTKRFFQMLWSYLGLVQALGILLGSGTGDATRLTTWPRQPVPVAAVRGGRSSRQCAQAGSPAGPLPAVAFPVPCHPCVSHLTGTL